MPMTMEERYEHAIAALQAYNRAKGEAEPDLSSHYEISDLICDLLHLTTSKDFHKSGVLDTALMHFKAEQREAERDIVPYFLSPFLTVHPICLTYPEDSAFLQGLNT